MEKILVVNSQKPLISPKPQITLWSVPKNKYINILPLTINEIHNKFHQCLIDWTSFETNGKWGLTIHEKKKKNAFHNWNNESIRPASCKWEAGKNC